MDRDSVESIETSWSHRLPNESPGAFAKFLIYRDLGAKRSFTNVARTSNISVSAVAQLALKYRWRQRAWAFDYAEQKEAEAQLARGRKAARERQIRLGMGLQDLGVRGLVEMQRKLEQGVPLNLTPREILLL